MPNRPFIALADPNWIGHRETYFREFVLSLHRVGADVAALCPHPERLENYVRHNSPDYEGQGRLITEELTEPSRLPLLNKLPHDPVATLRRWQRTAQALKDAQEKAGRAVDFLFLPWLDSYLRAYLNDGLVLRGIDCPWAGLYFRPYHLLNKQVPQTVLQHLAKGDALLSTRSCKGVAVLDETLQPTLSGETGKSVILFPDITDESAPDSEQPFARQIQATAQGRKVIGLIGLERRKGVVTLLQAADLARAAGEPWLFVLAGTIRLEEYSWSEQEFIKQHIQRSSERPAGHNVLFADELKPVPDGPAYNGVMSTFDILHTAYHDFDGSSNVLTKAAVLHKPVISTQSGCIGHRTDAYQLGISIPQGDAQAYIQAIYAIFKGINKDGSLLQPRYSDYYRQHNRARLDDAMRELIHLSGAEYALSPETVAAV